MNYFNLNFNFLIVNEFAKRKELNLNNYLNNSHKIDLKKKEPQVYFVKKAQFFRHK